MATKDVLRAHDLQAGYGSAQVLFGAGLRVGAGEAVALLGRNGMGKSTLIRSILGFTRVTGGRVEVNGRDVTGWPSHRVARAGIGWVPEGRQIFASLTVHENLMVSARLARRQGLWSLDRIHSMFPRLKERERNFGNQLSGGEQQMLAIARALLTQPALLVLDEATEGLAPLVRQDIWRTLMTVKAQGQSVLVVDRDLEALARVCDRFTVLERGRVAREGEVSELVSDRQAIERFLSV
ncbi:ABC transporter ATP-binding protein [Verminephrobacter eiseniae]|uniref:ABC transporter ATP-binding protein n=1 Tax=Verminephrobacter eiseniae TaxID=364317 RepID=UPI002237B338|nr:ABC transporter ATP-binding protein [Verminephrobacter eiseniae]MCW5230940.1 ABC transporter ATP-binding protein [Verminephrobacter eiseniae]MCW5292673.1 ABC transporter ATP-binding protein [Verminephrobacter eiseniae]MCW8187934.1 ABC transporter ATP-binding protein [Verminephrobacter eiseniae]MCW8226192.1 ABC transporter ATP-binding protein [Verminephrobacter eiseniae]MCW8236724.1 ABC transporter ATP-binding protein [Verminephrobacter eiseniae]